jgi:hypothetical protein
MLGWWVPKRRVVEAKARLSCSSLDSYVVETRCIVVVVVAHSGFSRLTLSEYSSLSLSQNSTSNLSPNLTA